MTLKIISAEDILFEGEVTSVKLPGRMGAFTVLQNHASLVSSTTMWLPFVYFSLSINLLTN